MIDTILGLAAVLIFLWALAQGTYFLVAMTFGRRDYSYFKAYRTNAGLECNWWIFLRHWLGAWDYKYKRYREDIVGESPIKTNIKRFTFVFIWAVTFVLSLTMTIVLYVSLSSE